MDLLHKAEIVQRESTTELSIFKKRLNDILAELQIDISTLEMYETQDGIDALLLDAKDMKTLEPSVADFEPHLALYGGEDGLDFYRAIVKNYKAALKAGGYLAFEFGEDQGNDICEILKENGFTILERTKDYHDTERAVLAQLGGEEE